MIGQIRRRGLEAPILLRFDGILRARVRELYEAFNQARAEYGYEAPYACVFPIKVNQQRHLVDVLLQEGRQQGMGVEIGSKPELLAVMALYSEKNRLVICNGYKDREYVETALLTSRLGTLPVLVVEKLSELQTILQASEELGIRPILGVRTKLGGRGAGRWKDSGGDRSKFGLTTREIVVLAEELQRHDMLDCLQLLHFHLGSQITRIRSIKNALGEATRTFTELIRVGAPIRWFDVGGGLGVDYDGSSTDFESSVNYTIREYASDVVSYVKEACEVADVPQPTILSESGRALTAHHAVLVTEVLGVTDFSTVGIPVHADQDEPDLIRYFVDVCERVDSDNFQECYHDANELRDEAMTLFNVGQLNLHDRARAEEFFWHTCEKILRVTRKLDYVPDDLEHLERDMADTYFLNFSVFQSMPDAWAIEQLFPILPLHRHDEEPTRRAVLADITCDSDGKIDRFIDLRDVKRILAEGVSEALAHLPDGLELGIGQHAVPRGFLPRRLHTGGRCGFQQTSGNGPAKELLDDRQHPVGHDGGTGLGDAVDQECHVPAANALELAALPLRRDVLLEQVLGPLRDALVPASVAVEEQDGHALESIRRTTLETPTVSGRVSSVVELVQGLPRLLASLGEP